MARYILKGACIERTEELSFNCSRLSYSGLPEWWSRSGIERSGSSELDGSGHRVTRFVYTDQDPLAVRLADAELSVELVWGGSTQRRRIDLHEAVCVRVRTDRLLSLDEWGERYDGPLRDLLTLATGHPSVLGHWIVECPVVRMEINGHSYPKPLEIEFSQPEPAALSSAGSPGDTLFSLDEVASDLGSVVQRWLEVRERFTLARQLYYSTRYVPSHMYVQSEFIYLVQACEIFHEIRFRNRGRKTAEAHAQAVQDVLAAVPDEHREWVELRLQGRPKTTLDDRLRFLCNQHEDIVKPLLSDVGDFCHRLAVTRNYLTHGGSKSSAVITDMLQFVHANWVLRILFEVCLLSELGIISSIRANPFEGAFRYVHLKANPLFQELPLRSGRGGVADFDRSPSSKEAENTVVPD